MLNSFESREHEPITIDVTVLAKATGVDTDLLHSDAVRFTWDSGDDRARYPDYTRGVSRVIYNDDGEGDPYVEIEYYLEGDPDFVRRNSFDLDRETLQFQTRDEVTPESETQFVCELKKLLGR